MSKDIFENSNHNYDFGVQEDNFFARPENIRFYEPQQEAAKRLNDYDYNILREDAYKDVTDEVFKLEYKIAKLEEEIKSLDAQIQTAKDVRDFTLLEHLFNRQKQCKEDLAGLMEIYNDTSLSAKISGGITGIIPAKIKEKLDAVRKITGALGEVIMSKLPGKFSSVIELKKSLAKLENINKSVDELMTLQTPYGEAGDKYEQLSKYITRANNIQAEISRSLKQ